MLSSATVRQRKPSKSELAVQKKGYDADLAFRFEISGPSVLGSRLVPRSHQSNLDIEAEDNELEEMQSRDLGDKQTTRQKELVVGRRSETS